MNAVDVRGVSFAHGPDAVLDDVDLEVEAGAFVGVVGENGAGKSTLLRLVAGLDRPSVGQVLVHGDVAGSLGARRHVSYLGDTPLLFPDLTLAQHASYVADLCALDDWRQPLDRLVEQLGLVGRTDLLPRQLSRGLKQRVVLALALLRPADVLVLDEPFGGLDVESRSALAALLRDRHRAGDTILVVTHDRAHVPDVTTWVEVGGGGLGRD